MEEVIARLAEQAVLMFQRADREFIRSINRRVERGEALTSRQGFAFLRILQNNPNARYEFGLDERQWEALIGNPQWQTPLKASVWLKREVRYMGNDVLAFRCTPSKEMSNDFTAMKAQYYGGVHLYTVPKNSHLLRAVEFIGKYDFQMDSETEQYLAGALSGQGRAASSAVWENNVVIDVPDDSILASYLVSVLGASPL